MLQFTEDQVDAISNEFERQFELRVTRRMQALFPEEMARIAARFSSEPDPGLGAVRQCLAYGRNKIGLERLPDLAILVALLVANVRSDVQGRPGELGWTRDVLEMDDDDGQAKLAVIENELEHAARGDARAAALSEKLKTIRADY